MCFAQNDGAIISQQLSMVEKSEMRLQSSAQKGITEWYDFPMQTAEMLKRNRHRCLIWKEWEASRCLRTDVSAISADE